MSRAVRIASVLLLSLTAMVQPVASSANTITRADANDSRWPLDLSLVRVTHKAGGHVFQLSTYEPMSNTQLKDGEDGFLVMAFDTNDDCVSGTSCDYERLMYVFYAAGKLRGVITNGNGRTVLYRDNPVSRVNAKSLKATVFPSRLGRGVKSYRFVVFSVYSGSPACTDRRPCVDAVPNRFPAVLHDFTPPQVRWESVPQVSTEISATLEVPVRFRINDDPFGSGIKNWVIEKKPVGGSWTQAEKGTGKGTITTRVSARQGVVWDLRVLGTDRQGNRSASKVERMSVPYDDAFTASAISIVYGGPGGPTDWTAATGASGLFMGTSHDSAVVGASVTVGFAGKKICLQGPANGAVDVAVDGGAASNEPVSATGRAAFVCRTLTAGDHTLVVTLTSGSVGLDSILVT
jgi:hypothetical protein